ncbi:MAG: histidine kinase [Saprospiraceae bacterium]
MRIISFIILFLSSQLCFGQQPYFYKLNYEKGFDSNEVYEIEQDSFGFIWIGCDAGIFRYDGVYFKQYIHPKQNGISISNLIIDEQQRVWCQNFTGQIFYIQNDSIHLFKDLTKETSAFPQFDIQNNDFIVVFPEYLVTYDIDTKNQKSKWLYQDTASNDLLIINLLIIQNRIYINSRDNIYFKEGSKPYRKLFETDQYTCHNLRKISGTVYTILQNNQTKEWIFAKLEKGKIVKPKVFPFNSSNGEIYMIKPFRDGFICCGTNGIYILDKAFNLLSHYFSNEKVTDALYDKEGNLWLTSLQNGIYIIPSIDVITLSADFFPNANITALRADENELLLGTYSGDIYNFNPQNTTFRTIDIKRYKDFFRVKKIVVDENSQLFSISERTVLIDKKTKQQTNINAGNVRDMLLFKDSLFSVNIGMLQRTDLKGNDSERILYGSGRMITKHPNSDTLFFSNKNGFFYYINGKIQEILKNENSVYPLCGVWQQDTLWLGTLSDGFIAYHNGQFFNHFYSLNDVDNNQKQLSVRSMQIYKKWLILATNIGIIRMDLKTKSMGIIDVNEGLYQKEITGIDVIDDEIFLATTTGLVRFPLLMSAKNTAIPNIKLNQIILNDSISIDLDKSSFSYYENSFRFEFQTALFRSRQKFHYEYRLIGLNDNWQTTNATSPFSQYQYLTAGEYRFEVRAVNEDNVSSNIISYSFSIASPIWKRWWFILIILVILAAIIYKIFTNRVRDIEQKATLENELKSSQLTALKAQMNPHFLYNSLNSIQDLILQEDVENANEYLTKFSHLMRRILEASEFFEIPLSKETQILELYLTLEKLRFGSKFQYNIQLSNAINSEQLKVPSMIIQPFVENAVKHGLLHKLNGVKTLAIDFKLKDALICTIVDNGIGRKEANKIKLRQGQQATSFATSATQKRLDILNQTYQQKIGLEIIDLYEDEKAVGTKVILRIPFTAFEV